MELEGLEKPQRWWNGPISDEQVSLPVTGRCHVLGKVDRTGPAVQYPVTEVASWCSQLGLRLSIS